MCAITFQRKQEEGGYAGELLRPLRLILSEGLSILSVIRLHPKDIEIVVYY